MEFLQRYTNPTKFDLAPYGTLCKNEETFFIQTSKDPDSACWIEFGVFLKVVFQDSILSKDFISSSLIAYESKKS